MTWRVLVGVALVIGAASVGVGVAVPLPEPLAAAGGGRSREHADYMLHCQGCHGPDGSGLPGSVPSFRGEVAKFLRVPGGREYLLRVPGTSQSELSDARIALLLNWLVHEFSAGEVPPDFVPYDEDEVRRVRRPPLLDVVGLRAQLIEAIRLQEAPASRP